MVSEKSLANLRKGRAKGTKKNRQSGKTWADLIREIGEQPSKVDPTKTNKQLVVEQAYTHAALGNAAILRELMQRSEPQDTNINVNIQKGYAVISPDDWDADANGDST